MLSYLARLRRYRVNHLILDGFTCRKLRWRTCEAVDLSGPPVPCNIETMVLYRFICRLLAAFVIAGLVLQPLAGPVAAKEVPLAATTHVTSMSAMSRDMPCCPDEKKNNGCHECPAAMCALMFAQAEPSSTNGIKISFQTRRLPFALDDLIADGLLSAPPDHPPRTST